MKYRDIETKLSIELSEYERNKSLQVDRLSNFEGCEDWEIEIVEIKEVDAKRFYANTCFFPDGIETEEVIIFKFKEEDNDCIRTKQENSR